MFAEPGPARQLAHYARQMREVSERYLGPLDITRVSAAADAEVAAFLARAERGRYAGPEHIAAAFADRGALRPGLTAQRAADIMFALTTYDVFRSLIHDRGWPARQAESWIADTLASQLLPPPAVSGG